MLLNLPVTLRHFSTHALYSETSVLLSSTADKQNNNEISEVLNNISYCFEALIHNQPVIQLLAILNFAIFLAWQILPNEFMEQHFINSAKNDRAHRWWSGFLSTYSHFSLSHIGANLCCLSIFGPPSYTYLGPARFFILIVFSSFASMIIPKLWNKSGLVSKKSREVMSLGFSGVNSALFVVYATARPKEQISMGDEDFVSATSALQVAILADLCGLVSTTRLFGFNSPIDHAAHLGGYISGYVSIVIFKALIRWRRFMISALQKWLQQVSRYTMMMRTNTRTPRRPKARIQPHNSQQHSIFSFMDRSHIIIFSVGIIAGTCIPLAWESRQLRKLRRRAKRVTKDFFS